MNNKLLYQLIKLISGFSEKESKSFRFGKKDENYLKLFNIICESVQKKGSDVEAEIEAKSKNENWNFNDVKINLRDHIFEFLWSVEIEKSKQAQLRKDLEIVDALYKRKQFDIAIDQLIKNYKSLMSIESNDENSFLFIKHINQVLRFQTERYGQDTQSLPKEFDVQITWLNSVTKAAIERTDTTRPDYKDISSDFGDNLLFDLVVDYHKKSKEWHKAYSAFSTNFSRIKELLEPDPPRPLLLKRTDATIKLLELSFKLNDPKLCDDALKLLTGNLTQLRDINYRLFVFFFSQIAEMRIALQLQSFPIEKKKFDSNPALFADVEIENVAERIEFNRAVFFLLSKEYKKSHVIFSKIYPKKRNPEFEFHIRLFDLITLRWGMNQGTDYTKDRYLIEYNILKELKYSKTKFINRVLKKIKEPDKVFDHVDEFIKTNQSEAQTLYEKVILEAFKHSLQHWDH
jgi:hypothetical protein